MEARKVCASHPENSGEITDVSGAFKYEMKCASRGFHEYRRVWTPRIRQSLTVQPEFGNVHDPYAMALLTKLAETILEMDIVGHLPREISRFCRYFVNYGGKLEVRVTDINYSRSPIPSGGLEIPILLIVIKANASPLVMGKMINEMKEYYTRKHCT